MSEENPGSSDVHGIFVSLRGDKCACGGWKRPGKSFCVRDYFRLPGAMRDALYQSDGYVEAFRAALRHLGLEEPKAELTLSAVFPPSRRGASLKRRPYR
jgi:hypothetical protein